MNIYITTPIYYVNAQPHLGHAYTTIIADTYSRYKRLCGGDVRFQTGTDEHGDKIAEAAKEKGVTPKEYADQISAMFKDAWPVLSISYDNFFRTTDDNHKKVVQDIMQKLYDQGDIVFSDYTGLYCKGCERFVTEKELVDGFCPDHQKAPAEICEKNYFFKMSNYQDWLINHINEHPDFITPERYKNEVLSFLSEPLEDLCISRPTSRLTWGIPLPFDANYVTYVWFDALINYITGIGYSAKDQPSSDFSKYWPVAEHVIAKDILKPHAIYWPTMLKSMGLEPYSKLHVSGFWNVDETKMSKSIGNVVRPQELVDQFGADAIRYFLLREMSFGLDSSFSFDALISRQNSDLANDLGNLFSRALAMVKKFTSSKVPAVPEQLTDIDKDLVDASMKMIEKFSKHIDVFEFHLALQAVWEVISRANKYIVENAPWELAKDASKRGRLEDVIYVLVETLRLISLPLHAVMPETAKKMQEGLGLQPLADFREVQWGTGLVVGSEIALQENLFPRIDKKQGAPKGDVSPKGGAGKTNIKSDKAETMAGEEDFVTFEDFKKFDLRVATIEAAERIKKSDRLLKLTVKAPEERTVVAGIAEYYQPEELIGKQVIIVANLKPAKLMGVTSHGMILAAKDGKQLVLSAVQGDVAPGSKVA